jgi:hypothetical protein
VPLRPLLARCGFALLVLLGAVLAAVGGVSLGGAGLIAVALVAVVAACLGAGIARENGGPDPRQASVDAAWRTAVGTVAALLLISGCVVLVGAALTVLATACVLGLLLLRWAFRSARADHQAAASVTAMPLPGSDRRWVRALTVQALGQEWVRSSAALARVRDPSTRQELVRRRQEALDELERRDPAGFARWLAGGATVDSDPAEHISGDPAAGSEAA